MNYNEVIREVRNELDCAMSNQSECYFTIEETRDILFWLEELRDTLEFDDIINSLEAELN